MAEVVWRTEALHQVREIRQYIAQDNPYAADRVADKLLRLGNSLGAFPNRGRPGPRGTREMATVPPYVLSYEVQGDYVFILGIRHGRRRPLG